MKVNGEIGGIRDVYIETLEKLYDMDAGTGNLISDDILNILISMTELLNKEISVFINRRGKVLDVSVGDNSTVHLPVLDYRRGVRRLSGVRCVHTHPQNTGQLSRVDISALINLRLDAIAAVGVNNGMANDIYIAYLSPVSGVLEEEYQVYGPYSRDAIAKINILDNIKQIEKGISSNAPEETNEGRKEKVILVGLNLPGSEGSDEDLLDELEQLALAAGADVLGKILQKRNKVDTAYYIGSGKAQELGLISQAYDIDTIIFDDELSGAQVRNLEEATGTKVIDRTTLILDIFADRAMTREGRLQVELAQLKYRSARLIGLGKILSRTGGGIGTRGPGEKKLEVDRRHIRERIEELEDDLEEVRKNRNIQREKRRTSQLPIVSLVGYTNSGKSTLRNYLTKVYQADSSVSREEVFAADMLFATLDPTTRLVRLPGGHEILVSDTVGFIRKLPHDLVEAFRATLEEVVYSDMLVHVVDASAQNAREQVEAVNIVLKQLDSASKPVILALNKIDKINDKDSLNLLRGIGSDVLEISALYGEGIEELLSSIENMLYSNIKTARIKIPYDKMSVKSSIYNECRVISEEYVEDSVIVTAEIDENVYKKFGQYIIE